MKNKEQNLYLSIVVPVYRSESIVFKLVKEIHSQMVGQSLDDRYELILVNDASPDDSWQKICEASKTYPSLKAISLRKNFGQHNATMAGLNHSAGEIVIIMDDDLQHPPDAIGLLLKQIEGGFDVCYTKYLNRKHALWKKLGSSFNNWVATKLINKPPTLYLSSFKAIRKNVVKEIIRYTGPYPYIDGLIMDVTRSLTSVEINHQERAEGIGNYNIKSSISLWLKMATNFSVTPLRLASYTGIVLSLFSLVLIMFVILQKLINPDMQAGWTSLIATILFIGGVQTLCIGMIGEYLGRTYLNANGKPQYVIAEQLNFESVNNSV